ncbi:hypothetical protein E2986_10986 [Frieseomelitta varia]|uniref:Cytochrome P450 n=1 Tax=Frieseomelitta varia TaxID=561572 RepID=A0A833RBA8_9HYME|nr:cytochrome P450 9e2-like [Frieseomelitta varia]KAF3419784.1 hypothetical protein E2986_10986 [Frieseomelitta varia]
MDYIPIALSLVAVLVALYYFTTRNHNLFKKHGIVHVPPSPLFGNMGSFARRQITMSDLIIKTYQLDPKAKYVGFYEFLTPIIVLRDLDLIKAVTMKNVEHFPDHRSLVNRKVDPMIGGMLFMLNGDHWKDHRNMLSPTFSSSKIKTMFRLMSECASRFAEHLSNLPEEKRETEMKSLLTKYTNDMIASCVYSVSIDSIKEPNNVFYEYGKLSTSTTSFKWSLKLLVHRNVPWLAELLQLNFVDSRIAKFFYNQVAETVETRQRTGARRSDILQLFMDNNKKREPGKEMTVQEMANHAFSFFFGGFDSVASQTCIVAHLLAENPDVQERVQQEIDETLENNNGELTYDAIHEMKYLVAVINETLRLYPIGSFIDRMCVKDFELPPARPGDKPFIVKAGMNVWIPVSAIHQDPKYYKNPLKFDPDRFYENKTITNSGTFLPFGLGPRMCIGNRFALTEMKVLLCHVLAKCNIKLASRTITPLQLKKGVFNATGRNGFWLAVEPRKSSYCFSTVSASAVSCN